MAALADPLGPPSKLDAIREHELYRYYHPLNSPGVTPPEAERNAFPGRNTLSANAASSPDTTLTVRQLSPPFPDLVLVLYLGRECSL